MKAVFDKSEIVFFGLGSESIMIRSSDGYGDLICDAESVALVISASGETRSSFMVTCTFV